MARMSKYDHMEIEPGEYLVGHSGKPVVFREIIPMGKSALPISANSMR
jgi:hypothetical protein